MEKIKKKLKPIKPNLLKIKKEKDAKELINNIKQVIHNLYDNEQITKQVYNNLIKAITYK